VAEDILLKFGKNIQSLRKEKGWSQEELADKAGFHRTYIGFIERGERNLSLRAIETLANAFSVKPFELLKPI
jgi:transcriptional regulator with XRE-family HTH domain